MTEPLHTNLLSFQASWFPIQTEDLPAPLNSAGRIYAEVVDYERTLYTPSLYSQSQQGAPRRTPTPPLSPIRDYVEESQGAFDHHSPRYNTAFPSPMFGNQGSPINTDGYIDVLKRKTWLAAQAPPPPPVRRQCWLLWLCLVMELSVVCLLVFGLANIDTQLGLVEYDGIGTASYNLFRFLPTTISTVLALCIETSYLLFRRTKAFHPLDRPCKGLNNSWTSFSTAMLALTSITLSSILFQPVVELSEDSLVWRWAVKPQVAAALLAVHVCFFALTSWMLFRMLKFKKTSYELQYNHGSESTESLIPKAKYFRFEAGWNIIEVLLFIAFWVMFHLTTPDFKPSLAVQSPESTSVRPADAVYTMVPVVLAFWIPVSRAPISTAFFPGTALEPYQKLVILLSTSSAWAIPILAGGLFSVQFSTTQQEMVVRPDMSALLLLLALVTCHFTFAVACHGSRLIRSLKSRRSEETAIVCIYDPKERPGNYV